MNNIKVRFAPSPTGPLHIGGARSALFNWLFARKNGGKMVLRIEDTDLERSSRESEEEIVASLRWLGVDWDEGVEVGGGNAPYRQTERLDFYNAHAQRLFESGHAYYCCCTEEELAAERDACMARGELPRYSGKCRSLSTQEQKNLIAKGQKMALRFRVPQDKIVTVNDLVRGKVEFQCNGIGDFIIVKSDGIPTYNFAVVIDDHLMEISHVIRAEEHLTNTPRQIMIYEALGWACPQFAHISLILGKDRSKMSKRHGATSLKQYREMGYLPEALMNFLALLGWSSGEENEIFSTEQLIQKFSMDRVAKSPAVFDLDKLNWINGYYIRHASLDRLTELALPFLQKEGYIDNTELSNEEYQKIKSIVNIAKDYLNNLSEIGPHVELFFKEPSYEQKDIKDILTQKQVPEVLSKVRDNILNSVALDEQAIKGYLKRLPKELGYGGKKVYVPLRVALTGKIQGPELYQVIPALGLEKVVGRLDRALVVAGK